MNQTSHPPARSTKQWMRALCTLVFTFVFALLLTGAAHAQAIGIGVDSFGRSVTPVAVTEEFPDDTKRPTGSPFSDTPGYFATVNIGTLITSPGPPPVIPPIAQTSQIVFVISGDTSLSGARRAATPSADLSLVPNPNVTAAPLPDGSLQVTVTIRAGSRDVFVLFLANQDADTEGTEGYRVTLTNVLSGSATIVSDAADAYGTIVDPTNASPSLFTVTPTNLSINERDFKEFTIQPTVAPTKDATIQLTTTNPGTIAIDKTTLVFRAGSTVAQTVRVTALSDNAFLPNIRSATVQTTNVNSEDTNFNNSPVADVNVVVFNTDQNSSGNANFTVTPSNVVVKEGETSTFTVTINAAPVFPVYVPLTVADPTVARIVGANILVFDSTSPLTQVVTVQGISDNALNPPSRTTTITTGNSISTDDAYNNVVIPDVPVYVINNDTLFKVSRTTGLVTRESGSTDTFTVALNVAPTADVTLTLTANSSPNEEVRLRTANTPTAASTATLTFTAANFATPQTVTVVGVNDNVADGVAPFTITGTATSLDSNYAFQAPPPISGINIPAAFTITPTSGLVTKEGSNVPASFTVALNFAPTSTVTVNFSISPTSEATFMGGASTYPVTFAAGSTTPQTVLVLSADDLLIDGDKPFTITGTVTSADTNIAGQTVPTVTGVNQDNEVGTPTPTPTATPGGGNNGTGPTYAAGTRNLVSFPYTLTTDGEGKGTATVAQAFGSPTSSLGVRYTLYRYNAEGQKYSFTTTSGALGTDWVPMNAGDTLALGQGYLLVVGNAGSVSMNTPADDATLTAITSPTFQIALKRNPTFVKDTRKTQSFNGYNLIGFPFDPSRYTSVNLSNVQVISSTNGRPDVRYESLSKAAAAGVIKGTVYGIDSQGRLVALSASNYSLARYKAVFVQTFRDSGVTRIVLRNPS